MKSVSLLLIVLILITPCFTVKIFLMGGGCNENSTQVFTALANSVAGRIPQPKRCDQNWNSTKCPRIAIVTSAANSQADGNDAYSNDSQAMSYKTLMSNYGLTTRHISVHVDNYKTDSDMSTSKGKANLEIIKQADIIYFNGGDQSRHIRSWLNDDGTRNQMLQAILTRALNNEVILAGTSAGTMIWTNSTFGEGSSFGALYFKNSVGLAPKKVIDGAVNGTGLKDVRNGTRSLQYDQNAGKMPGFQLLNFTSDTHFNARGRLGRLVPVLVDLGQKFGIGVDQNTTIFYDNGVGTVYGWNGVTLCDLQNSVISSQSYFSIKNVTVHFLSEGDKFIFSEKKVESSKPLIGTPAYINPTDSSDILSGYEASLLITRLVNQRASYNVGRTRIPSGYPRNTPTFQMKFSKGANTRGYYSNKKYTAQNVVVDFSYSTNNLIVEQE